MRKALLTGLAIVQGVSAYGEDLPPIPDDLANTSAVVCVKVSNEGAVAGAFIVQSAGSLAKDNELLAWVRQLHWPKAAAGETGREVWFPMPVTIGNAAPLAMPESCDTKAPPFPQT